MSTSKSIHQKRFQRTAIRRLPHHFFLSLTRQKSAFRAWLNGHGKRFIDDDTTESHFDRQLINKYKKTVTTVTLWHGTGRYHYENDVVVDVLKKVIHDGGLRPFTDAYAIFSGGEGMKSISLTHSRIIARSYADIHGAAIHEKGRYGSGFFWVSYYYGLFYAKLYLFKGITLRKNWATWHKLTHNEAGENTWGKKVNQSARDVWDTFTTGSDIRDNFPIVMGIKTIDEKVGLSKIFNSYEVRSARKIPLKQLTHVEVPSDKVEEVKKLLKDRGIPVYPIELAEKLASTATISELLAI